MNRTLFLPLAAIAVLTIAACEQQSETPSATVEIETGETFDDVQSEADQAGDALLDIANNVVNSTQQQLDAAGAALAETSNEVRQAMGEQMDSIVTNLEDMRDENMTDEQKLEAVTNARNTAEGTARAAGLDEDQIAEAGDAAERAARNVLGL
jgi:exonuclease VII large subunit